MKLARRMVLLGALSTSLSALSSYTYAAKPKGTAISTIEMTCTRIEKKIDGLAKDPSWHKTLLAIYLETKDEHVFRSCFESPKHLLYVVSIPQAIADKTDWAPLFDLAAKNIKFADFLVESLNELTPLSTLVKIKERSKVNCSRAHQKLCKRLGLRVDEVFAIAKSFEASGEIPD